MITKEVAAKIHNAYTEIEHGTKMIDELKKHLDKEGNFEIKDGWGNTRGLELHIPTSLANSMSVKRVPFTLALDVLTLHIENQKKELERLKEVCRIQLA